MHRRYRTADAPLFGCCSVLTSALLLCLSACGGDSAPTSPSPSEDAGTACSAPGDPFSLGLSKISPGGLKVAIDDANPAPPGIGKNHWKLHVTDAAGAAISGATVTLSLYMPPPHDHPQPGTVGKEQPDGSYDVDDLNLTMPGLFNITVKVIPPSATVEEVRFQFCVERKGN